MSVKFTELVLKIVAQIRVGQTMTYGQVAALAGNPKAAREVGMIMSKNWDVKIPCHRVVRADGSAGGYNRGREQKIKLLSQERFLAKY